MQRDGKDNVFTGAAYNFDISKVPNSHWQLIADRVAQHFGFTNAQRKSCILYIISHIHTHCMPLQPRFVGESRRHRHRHRLVRPERVSDHLRALQ